MGTDKDDYMECLDIKVLKQTENSFFYVLKQFCNA